MNNESSILKKKKKEIGDTISTYPESNHHNGSWKFGRLFLTESRTYMVQIVTNARVRDI